MNESFKIGIYHGVYYHPDRNELQYSCRITNPNTGEQIEEFFATEREAAIFWNEKAIELLKDHKDQHLMKLNKIPDLPANTQGPYFG